MVADLNRAELDALLGAYALDAVDGDEARQVARFLETNADARDEVAGHREIAGWLVQPIADVPDLWPGIERAIRVQRPTTGARARALSRRVGAKRRILAAAAVLLLVVAIALVGGELWNHDDGGARSRIVAAAVAARRDPDALRARLDSPDGSQHVRVVYLPNGRGYVLGNDLPPLPRGQTYQLWALVGSGPDLRATSAGLLGRRVDAEAFRFVGQVELFAITAEDVPGASQPSEAPRVAGALG